MTEDVQARPYSLNGVQKLVVTHPGRQPGLFKAMKPRESRYMRSGLRSPSEKLLKLFVRRGIDDR
jgi:hypothetical protein